MLDNLTLVAGIALLAASTFLFWRALPKDGKPARFVGSYFEGLIGVAFCGGFAISATMIIHSVSDMISH